jgi:Tfp pilus assembly protein PilN
VKALHPNLASRPYRDYRPVWTVLAVLAIFSVALLAYNVQTAYRYFATTSDTRAEISALEASIAEERQATRTAREQAARFDSPELRRRAEFVNARIAERAFSWNQLLDDLEAVFPPDVRLVRLSPTVEKTGDVTLTMQCFARNGDGMVDLIQNMFSSPKFVRPFPANQSTSSTGLHQFVISTQYRPSVREVIE